MATTSTNVQMVAAAPRDGCCQCPCPQGKPQSPPPLARLSRRLSKTSRSHLTLRGYINTILFCSRSRRKVNTEEQNNCHNQASQDKCHQTFPCYPERRSKGIVLDSRNNLKGNFHKALSPWCPANKGAGCPHVSRSRNPLRWHQLWFSHGTIIYKRKSDGIYLINLKRTEERLLAACRVTQSLLGAMRTSPSSRNNNKAAHSRVRRGRRCPGEVPRMPGTGSRDRGQPDLYFRWEADESEKEEQGAAGKAVTKEEFQGAPAPKLPATPPPRSRLKVHVPSVPTQQFPPEDGASARPPWTHLETPSLWPRNG